MKKLELDNTVIYDKDLYSKFDANLIDNLRVKSIFNDEFLTCEHWGWNEEGEGNQPYYDFGRIGDFDFMIYRNKTRLFIGENDFHHSK
jgi:hypothetical protein